MAFWAVRWVCSCAVLSRCPSPTQAQRGLSLSHHHLCLVCCGCHLSVHGRSASQPRVCRSPLPSPYLANSHSSRWAGDREDSLREPCNPINEFLSCSFLFSPTHSDPSTMEKNQGISPVGCPPCVWFTFQQQRLLKLFLKIINRSGEKFCITKWGNE